MGITVVETCPCDAKTQHNYIMPAATQAHTHVKERFNTGWVVVASGLPYLISADQELCYLLAVEEVCAT